MKFHWLLLVTTGAFVTASCTRESATGSAGHPSPLPAKTNTQVFQVKGTVVELKLSEKTVRIKHEEIPGYMPAMTMPFEVKDVRELDKLEAGDSVAFRMIVMENDAWIDQVKKLNTTANTNLPKTGPFRLVRDVEPLNVGDMLPEYHFTNQLGQAISLSQFRGQAIALTFIFTRCPFPTFCPLMSRNFEEVQTKLLATPGAATNWHLLTITFDPEWDTPPRLKGYATQFHSDARHWSFLTGTLMDITAIAEQSGLLFWREGEGGNISHNLRTVIVDAGGRVEKILTENKWTSDDLVAEILKAAQTKP